MKKSYVAMLACSAFAACAMPQWVYLGRQHDDRRNQVFVNASSIRLAGDIRRASRMVVYPAHTINGQGAFSSRWISAYYYREAFDCSEKKHKIEVSQIRYEDGASSPTPPESVSPDWQFVSADTVDESAMKFVCSWKVS